MKKQTITYLLIVSGVSIFSLVYFPSEQQPNNAAPELNHTSNTHTNLVINNNLKQDNNATPSKNNNLQPNTLKTDIHTSNKEVKPWRRPSTHFQSFIDLMNKPLATDIEKIQLRTMMDNYALLNTSKEILTLPVQGKDLNLVDERERLDAVLYLTTILAGKYNSSQVELAEELVVDILNTERIQDTHSRDLKKSLMGDKVELGLALAVFHAERWKLYKDTYQLGEKHQQLINYIDSLAILKTEQLKSHAQRIANRLKSINNHSG